MNKRDYYEVLGIDKKASSSEIKKAFKKLAILFHPDKQASKSDEEKKEAEEKFKEINEAYGILNDKEKRQQYDNFGFDTPRNNGFGGADDLNEFLRRAHADFFGGFNNPGKTQVQQIRISVGLTLSEMFNGTFKKFKYKVNRVCSHCHGEQFIASDGGKKETCKTCNGSGRVQEVNGNMIFTGTCHDCGGSGYHIINGCKACNATGYEQKDELIEITIPKGIPNGAYINFTGKGNEQIINGTSVIGDLIIIINEIQDGNFIRNGNDLHCNLDVSIYDCLLGEEVIVETIDNKKRKFKLKIGTETGNEFRLVGLGMPIMDTSNFGDLYVHIKNIMPNTNTEKEIELLRELKELKNK